jgi:transposase InsO family protein
VSHPNARLTVHGRLVLVRRIESGWSISAAARAAGVSRQTAGKWFARYREQGNGGLVDASSRPHRTRPCVPIRRARRILKARLLHKRGPHWLSWRLHIARSTIYAVLRRYGFSRLKVRSNEPVVRYEWPCPGDLVHLDVKKLGRIPTGGGHRVHGRCATTHHSAQGWEFVHVAVDDHSRLAYAEVLADERDTTTVGFVDRALDFFEAAGFATRRILTDNGNNYRSNAFLAALDRRGIEARKTRPYHPQTNGKAEAFVKIVTNEWAYGAAYLSNEERAQMLGPFLHDYNLFRPHGGLGGQTPISRIS